MFVGFKHSEESKQKMREARLKNPQGFKKGNIINLGRKYSEEHKNNISIAHKNYTPKMAGWNKGMILPLNWREKLSKVKKGKWEKEKNPNWAGGISGNNQESRNSMNYRFWRDAIFKRDYYTCQHCGIKSGCGYKVVFNAHHIKSYSEFPELRYCIDNGITLCVTCHQKTDNFGGKYMRKLRKGLAYGNT